MKRGKYLGAVCAMTLAVAAASPGCARAQSVKTVRYSIPSQDLGTALTQLAQQSGRRIHFSSDVTRGRRSPSLQAQLTFEQALEALLRGTDLDYRGGSDGSIIIEKHAAYVPAASLQQEGGEPEATEILVTGTRIAGAAPASPVVTITQQQMKEAGQKDLGEAMRSLPMNFNGGQNPGVRAGSTGSSLANQDVTGGSSANLRGIGPDATLTLLNGRRLSYDGFSQSVDLDNIPLEAVSSLQIVPDGSSALYGSDAVAGVVNVVLKHDYEGLATNARIGTSTEGGGFQQEYGVTAGASWSSGGFLVAGQFGRQEAITSADRDFTTYLARPADLLGENEHHGGLLTAHQAITPSITLGVDALYNKRFVFNRVAPFSATRSSTEKRSESYVIAPNATISLPARWTLTLSGIYSAGQGEVTSISNNTATGVITRSVTCYCNDSTAAEIGAEGPLVDLTGGSVRLASGGGYRENSFHSINRTTGARIGGSRNSRFAYGEINIPLVSDANSSGLLHRLSLSGALRYEHYSDFGDVTTPKLGLIYAPVEGLEFKGTWGRSFKAPTLFQQFQQSYVYLYSAANVGGTGYPSNATVLISYGGNRALRAERAETWSATMSLAPRGLEGFHASLSYFNVHYTDRALLPINNQTALSNPAYSEFVTFTPSTASQAATIAQASGGFFNFSGAAYDPANVVALASNLYANVASQNIDGIDLDTSYRFSAAGGATNLSMRASWLRSDQKNSASAPTFQLAGVVFNPPSFRARAGASWSGSSLTASAFMNYIGGVSDNRQTPAVDGDAMVTFDLTVIYHLGETGTPLGKLDLALSIQNLTDAAPPYLRNSLADYVNYDSTNYSAIGRFVSFSISKRW